MSETITTAKLESAPQDRFVRLRRDLGVQSFGVNQIVLAPGERNRIHRHTHQEEVYVVLDGVLTLMVEGEPHEFLTGDVVRVAPSVRRQLVNRHKQPVSLLALGGDAAHSHEPRDAEPFLDWDEDSPGTLQEVPLPEDLAAHELVG